MRQNMTKAHKYVVLGQGYTCGGKWDAVEVSELIVTELIKTYNIMFSVFVLVFMWMDGWGLGGVGE